MVAAVHTSRHGKRPTPQRSVAPQHPHQAIGWVRGQLVIKPSGAYIKATEGKVAINRIKDQRLLVTLLAHAADWQERELLWAVYPQPAGKGFALAGVVMEPKGDQAHGRFKVIGSVQQAQEGELLLRVYRAGKPIFNLISVSGHVPAARQREIWRCICSLKDGRLELESAERLAEAPAKKAYGARKEGFSRN